SHAITAVYTGDGNFTTSTGNLAQAVNAAGTSVSLGSSANPSSFGQSVTFTATIGVVAPGTTFVASPTGNVTFYDGATPLGTVAVTTTGGVTTAAFSSAGLSVAASHAITAV